MYRRPMTHYGEMSCGGKLWEIRIRGYIGRMTKKMAECAISAVMLDGQMSNYVDILQGAEQ